jgi:small subunit ribosomal protein S2
MSVVTLEELVNAGVYFGHQSNRWNPKMFPYIYTKKNGTHLIDLVQTACALIHVHDFVQKQAKENKNFFYLLGLKDKQQIQLFKRLKNVTLLI